MPHKKKTAETKDGLLAGTVKPPVVGLVLVSALAQNQTTIRAFTANNLNDLAKQIRIAANSKR